MLGPVLATFLLLLVWGAYAPSWERVRECGEVVLAQSVCVSINNVRAVKGDVAAARAQANALARRGRDVVPHLLVTVLTHDDPWVRRWAAHALGEIGSTAEPADATLTEALNDEDEAVRDAVKTAIERIKGGQ